MSNESNNNIRVIILCGGTGSRLWPLSRTNHPKQFLKLIDNKSLFEMALRRANNISNQKPIVVCSEDHQYFIKDEIKNTGIECEIIYESIGRNTCASVFFGTKFLADTNEKSKVVILASDHLILDENYFFKQIKKFISISDQYSWFLFGKKPTYASTGYGYIKSTQSDSLNSHVTSFIEKPNKKHAKELIKDPMNFWNMGIFCGDCSKMLESIKKHSPDIYKACNEAWLNKLKINESYSITKQDLLMVRSESIDVGVLEQEKSIGLIPYEGDWSDLGTWDSIANSLKDSSQSLSIDSKNNYFFSTNKLIATSGVEDLIIVDGGDAILVMKKDHGESIKELVSKLKEKRMPQLNNNSGETRPWGTFTNLLEKDTHKVKELTIFPHQAISLQYHHHRKETWVVVKGTATVILNNDKLILNVGDAVTIEQGDHHQLINDTDENLTITETQTGTYFGEDDIVRLDDPYNR